MNFCEKIERYIIYLRLFDIFLRGKIIKCQRENKKRKIVRRAENREDIFSFFQSFILCRKLDIIISIHIYIYHHSYSNRTDSWLKRVIEANESFGKRSTTRKKKQSAIWIADDLISRRDMRALSHRVACLSHDQ